MTDSQGTPSSNPCLPSEGQVTPLFLNTAGNLTLGSRGNKIAESELHLDLSRLEKVRHVGAKITARCPACVATGNDRTGDHLVILPSGKFGCTVGRDREHRREIFALVGIRGERKLDPRRDREWREQRDKERHLAESRQHLIETAREKRGAIIARHPWAPEDLWESSPQRLDCELVTSDPRHFLDTMFPLDSRVWAGEVFHSGTRHADRWRTVADWLNSPLPHIGPMTTPAVWKRGISNRTGENTQSAPYVVADFDGFDDHKPESPAEIRAHIRASLAISRWMREGLGWSLAAIISTGGKSIHCWFHTPPPAVLQSLRDSATALGIDSGLIDRPEHPCRLPGQTHAKTGQMSRLLWLQNPTE